MSDFIKTAHSSKSNEWGTPDSIYRPLDQEFGFSLDPCARNAEEAKCQRFYTPAEDGLLQPWGEEIVFCNPPYGREIGRWVQKAYLAAHDGATVVMLIPARTDTNYWHDYVIGAGAEVRFCKGRISFVNNDTGQVEDPAPFPSAVVVFRPEDFV